MEREQHGAMTEKFMLKHATLQRDRDCDRSMLILTMEPEEEVKEALGNRGMSLLGGRQDVLGPGMVSEVIS